MSEKVYAWLLRLYPSNFRNLYGNEALQLFRDRARDEKGFLPRLRLWLDLLGDLGLSVPREYLRLEPELRSSSLRVSTKDGPSFVVLELQPLGATTLLSGCVLSLMAFLTFSVLLNRGVRPVPLSALFRPAQGAADPGSPAFNSSRTQASTYTGREGTIVSQSQTQLDTSAKSSAQANSVARDSQSNAPSSQDRSQPPQRQDGQSFGATNPSRTETKLDATEKQRVVEAAIKNLKAHYFDPDVAQKMADALLAREKSGDDAAATDGSAFADLLTKQMRDVSHDMHLELAYSQDHLPASRFDALGRPLGPTPDDHARYRKIMEQENCTFEKAQIVAHNIGYLKLNSFPDPSICRPKAVAAMASLNDADAIIFDLRDNRGGEPEMVALMAAYLFDRPEYWYNPRENTTQRSWTQSPVPGNKLADKPVYVLTSARTFSGAEQFSYDLKMLKRATLVGETTGGAAHSGVFYRIDDHFGIAIPETKPINPFSKTDWAEKGLEPDVKVKAADALETAMKLAQSRLQIK
jgi:Peptidase family S41